MGRWFRTFIVISYNRLVPTFVQAGLVFKVSSEPAIYTSGIPVESSSGSCDSAAIDTSMVLEF